MSEFPRITGSEEPIGGEGYQYNITGCGPIKAIITESGPNISSQGAVESLLFAASMGGDMIEKAFGSSEPGKRPYDSSLASRIVGRAQLAGGAYGSDVEALVGMLDWFVSELDELDNEDALGTEGWRRRLGIEG